MTTESGAVYTVLAGKRVEFTYHLQPNKPWGSVTIYMGNHKWFSWFNLDYFQRATVYPVTSSARAGELVTLRGKGFGKFVYDSEDGASAICLGPVTATKLECQNWIWGRDLVDWKDQSITFRLTDTNGGMIQPGERFLFVFPARSNTSLPIRITVVRQQLH